MLPEKEDGGKNERKRRRTETPRIFSPDQGPAPFLRRNRRAAEDGSGAAHNQFLSRLPDLLSRRAAETPAQAAGYLIYLIHNQELSLILLFHENTVYRSGVAGFAAGRVRL